MDFTAHNEDVRQVWESYRAGKPVRVPIFFGINTRYTLLNPEANRNGVTFREYFADPRVMLEYQLEMLEWIRFNIPYDQEMGLPEAWNVWVDFQNVYEAAWFGCPIVYDDEQVPDTEPILTGDRKRMLFDQGIPDPFEGPLMRDAWSFFEQMKGICEGGFTYRGRPVNVTGVCGGGTDGPMTVACNIRGASEWCTDLAADPDYAHELLDYLTEATIARIRAFRERLGLPAVEQGFGFADDSIALLSTDMYREMIMPYHRRLIEAFSKGGPNSVHLCGDATRHFPLLQKELNIQSFDTGFPVDFGWVRKTLGPGAEFAGGPSGPLLVNGSPDDVREETKRILQSGIMDGGRFMLREGNNLAPGTPMANMLAMIEAGKEYGRYAS